MACIAGGWGLNAQSHRNQDFSSLLGERGHSESPYPLRVFASLLLAFENPALAWHFMGHSHSLVGHRRALSAKSRGSSFLEDIDADFFRNSSDDGSDDSVPDFVPKAFFPPSQEDFIEGVPDKLPEKLVLDSDGGLFSFLMQRAVQTRCHYYSTQSKTNDRAYSKSQWLSENADVPGDLHGIQQIPFDKWRAWLLSLMSQSRFNITVEDFFDEFTIEIDALGIANDVMDTAEVVAEELINNLKILNKTDNNFWERWTQLVETGKDKDLKSAKIRRQDVDGFDSEWNFDLLEALTTCRAVTATLRQTKRDDEMAYRLLNEYWEEKGIVLLGDVLQYHAADEFLFGLLQKPWTMVEGQVVEPHSLVEQVLESRRSISLDWIQRLEETDKVFLSIRREHLEQKIKE